MFSRRLEPIFFPYAVSDPCVPRASLLRRGFGAASWGRSLPLCGGNGESKTQLPARRSTRRGLTLLVGLEKQAVPL